jgi:TRAP-type C4-dicarboxylate transport system permease small subunit
MLLFTLTDVIIRQFGKPIFGDYEVISYLGAVVVGFAIPYAALKKAHVNVDFILETMSPKASTAMQIGTRIIVIAFSLLIAWNLILLSVDMIKTNEVTPMFRAPYYPITLGVALAFIIQCLPLISEIRSLGGGSHE